VVFKDKIFPGLLKTPREGKWYEYLAIATGGKIGKGNSSDEECMPVEYTTVDWDNSARFVDCKQDPANFISKSCREQQKRFEIVKEMEVSDLKKVLEELDLLSNST